MIDPAAAAQRLEDAFVLIHETRMQDIPILNHRLAVEAVGFRPWEDDFLGILITPWFINLVLFPGSAERAASLLKTKLRDSLSHTFPAGRFSFILGEEEGLGRFQMCSLFSPVLEFEDQEAARLAAEAALSALLEGEGQDQGENPDRHLINMARGRFPTDEEVAAVQVVANEPSREVSRRGILTGERRSQERPA